MHIIYVGGNWIKQGSKAPYDTYTAYGAAACGAETHLIVKNATKGATREVYRRHFDLDFPETLTIHRLNHLLNKGNIEFYLKAARLIRRLSDYNTLVITRVPKLIPYLLAIRNRKFNLFYETHNFFIDPSQRNDFTNPYKHRRTARIEQKKFPNLDGLICLSQTQKALWDAYLNIPKFVVLPGLFSYPQEKMPTDTINLAFVGLMELNKGIERIMQMTAHLPNNYRVTFFGGRHQKRLEQLHALAAKHGVSQRIEITGWLTPKELHQRLRYIHLGLLPLKANFFNNYITVPSKFFDYLSHQIPVISSPLPALTELVEGYQVGRTVNWNNPQKTARAITTLMNDQHTYTRLQENIQAFARKHNWQKRGEKLNNLTHQIHK